MNVSSIKKVLSIFAIIALTFFAGCVDNGVSNTKTIFVTD